MFSLLTLALVLTQQTWATPNSSSEEIQKLLSEEKELVAKILKVEDQDSILAASSSSETKTTITAVPLKEDAELSTLLPKPSSSQEVVRDLKKLKEDLELAVMENNNELHQEKSSFESMKNKSKRLSALSQRALIDTHDAQTRTAIMRMKVRELSAETPIADFPNAVQHKYIQPQREIRYRHSYRHTSLPAYDEQLALPSFQPTKIERAEDEIANTSLSQAHPLAIITSAQAPLFAAPSFDGAELASLEQGEALVIEKRLKNWYRIISQTGVRGWIRTEHLLFGPTHNSYPQKIVRLKGYDALADNAG